MPEWKNSSTINDTLVTRRLLTITVILFTFVSPKNRFTVYFVPSIFTQFYIRYIHLSIPFFHVTMSMSDSSSPFRLLLLLSTIFALVFLTQFADCNKLARGWGDDINWVTLEKAKEISVQDKKPVMVRSWKYILYKGKTPVCIAVSWFQV